MLLLAADAAAAAGDDDDDERVDNRMNVLTLRLRFIHNALLWLPAIGGPTMWTEEETCTASKRVNDVLLNVTLKRLGRVFSGALHKILSS